MAISTSLPELTVCVAALKIGAWDSFGIIVIFTVIFGVWAFIGWVIYGLGCIIFLRYKGVGIR